VACTSPKLFAACHVLHRLYAPRYPPNALKTFDLSTSCHAQKSNQTKSGSIVCFTSGAGVHIRGLRLRTIRSDAQSRLPTAKLPEPFLHTPKAHSTTIPSPTSIRHTSSTDADAGD